VAVLKKLSVTAALVAAACLPAGAQSARAHAHRTVATQSAVAQAEFDRGLGMLYAFNVGEARLAFKAAETADPHAAVAYACEAVADTIDINLPSTSAGEARGATAVARGRASASDASGDDRALLEAVAVRYDLSKPLKQRYVAYFSAMQQYADTHASDGMAHTLAAYAGWNAVDLLTDGSRQLVPSAKTMLDDLSAAVALDPDDLGAHHLLIHFWEGAGHPERALPDANYLAGLTYDPGQSHLPHMAGHTYARVGNYDALVAVNEAAVHYDEAYSQLGNGDGQRYMQLYHDHDVGFVLYGLTTVGRDAEARTFAAKESAFERGLLALRLHDGSRAAALLPATSAMGVVAEVRSGDLAAADRDLAVLAKAGTDDAAIALPRAVIERAKHEDDAAVRDYRIALSKQGNDLGDPKNSWSTPVGEGLGATLLEAQRYPEAQAVFERELVRYPNDPHLFFGLAEALKAQGKDDTAARRSYTDAWRGEHALTLADLG